MSNWIQEAAEKIRERERQSAQARQWLLHKAETIKVKGMELWPPIVDAVKSSVEEFNSQFPNDVSKYIEFNIIPSRGVTLRKPYFPAVTVESSLDERRQVIHISVTRTRNHDSGSKTADFQYPIDLEEDGLLYVKDGTFPLTPAEVAANLIRPIIDSF
jgi:hypothetical protein